MIDDETMCMNIDEALLFDLERRMERVDDRNWVLASIKIRDKSIYISKQFRQPPVTNTS